MTWREDPHPVSNMKRTANASFSQSSSQGLLSHFLSPYLFSSVLLEFSFPSYTHGLCANSSFPCSCKTFLTTKDSAAHKAGSQAAAGGKFSKLTAENCWDASLSSWCPHFSLAAGTWQPCQQCLEQLAPSSSIWCWGGCRGGESSWSSG